MSIGKDLKCCIFHYFDQETIETEYPGYLEQRRTPLYVGTSKGVDRFYQQTFIDTYTKVALAKPYDRKNAFGG